MSDSNHYFTVCEPTVAEIPLVVEVPHSGLMFDPESLAFCSAPARSIGTDADLYVSELFAGAPALGAHLIYCRLSRYVCDLNREPTDIDMHTSVHGAATSAPHGLVWRKTTEGRSALVSPLPHSEIERRLALIYRPYHERLAHIIAQKKERFGFVILLCGHSMPSFGRSGERRADVVPGTQGRTTAHALVIQTTEEVTREAGYDIAHDTPYRGGYTTQHYGSPAGNVHAIQIELSRRLYMDENTLSRTDGFVRCEAYCRNLMQSLGTLSLKFQ